MSINFIRKQKMPLPLPASLIYNEHQGVNNSKEDNRKHKEVAIWILYSDFKDPTNTEVSLNMLRAINIEGYLKSGMTIINCIQS